MPLQDGFRPPQRTPMVIDEWPTTYSGRKAFAQSHSNYHLIPVWFTSANHYKKKRIANVLTLDLDMLNDSHRISNQVLILIVQYIACRVIPLPCVRGGNTPRHRTSKGRRSGRVVGGELLVVPSGQVSNFTPVRFTAHL